MNRLKGKKVLITGASSGIGKACATEFAKQGCDLILTCRERSFENLLELSSELEEKYQVIVKPYYFDVRDKAQVDFAIDNLEPEFKKIDILVNNAGLAAGLAKLHESLIDDFERMIDTNIKGLLYFTHKIVPLMLKYQTAGHIINIGSIAGEAAYKNGSVYCGTKAAVKLISDGLRIDLVDTPIRVTNIEPGLVETNFSVVRFHGDEEKAANVYKGLKPLYGEDIADLVVYCANAPAHVQICEVIVTPTAQANGSTVHR